MLVCLIVIGFMEGWGQALKFGIIFLISLFILIVSLAVLKLPVEGSAVKVLIALFWGGWAVVLFLRCIIKGYINRY